MNSSLVERIIVRPEIPPPFGGSVEIVHRGVVVVVVAHHAVERRVELAQVGIRLLKAVAVGLPVAVVGLVAESYHERRVAAGTQGVKRGIDVRHGGGVEARHLAGAVAYLIVGKGYERKTRIVHFVEHEIRRLVLVGRARDKPPEQRQVGIGGRGRIARRRADKHQSGGLVGFDAVMPRRVCLHHAEAVRHRHTGQRSARTVPDNAADYRSTCGYRRQRRRNN